MCTFLPQAVLCTCLTAALTTCLTAGLTLAKCHDVCGGSSSQAHFLCVHVCGSRTKRIADVTAGCTGVHCFFGSTDRRQMSFQFFITDVIGRRLVYVDSAKFVFLSCRILPRCHDSCVTGVRMCMTCTYVTFCPLLHVKGASGKLS